MKKGIKRYFLNLDYLEVRKTNLKQEQGFLFVCFFFVLFSLLNWGQIDNSRKISCFVSLSFQDHVSLRCLNMSSHQLFVSINSF